MYTHTINMDNTSSKSQYIPHVNKRYIDLPFPTLGRVPTFLTFLSALPPLPPRPPPLPPLPPLAPLPPPFPMAICVTARENETLINRTIFPFQWKVPLVYGWLHNGRMREWPFRLGWRCRQDAGEKKISSFSCQTRRQDINWICLLQDHAASATGHFVIEIVSVTGDFTRATVTVTWQWPRSLTIRLISMPNADPDRHSYEI